MDIGCPECDATIDASVPPGPGIHAESDSNRLLGTETECRNCGHELELYYY
ncbi:hypothetical protein SAMN05216285_0322 [Natrinema salifodinae]|uniref:Small CPxCG-related zinc finger protein n=2 Tax=Natrinema salifodinae TaxID=1202768 RepID=A0A1I0M2P6_9EURY|nr:hypothetical protein SAMN05216285_0322 [Natrinema salifodinae]